jgi:hypothetical protein
MLGRHIKKANARLAILTFSLRIQINVSSIFFEAELLWINVQDLDDIGDQIREGFVHLEMRKNALKYLEPHFHIRKQMLHLQSQTMKLRF